MFHGKKLPNETDQKIFDGLLAILTDLGYVNDEARFIEMLASEANNKGIPVPEPDSGFWPLTVVCRGEKSDDWHIVEDILDLVMIIKDNISTEHLDLVDAHVQANMPAMAHVASVVIRGVPGNEDYPSRVSVLMSDEDGQMQDISSMFQSSPTKQA